MIYLLYELSSCLEMCSSFNVQKLLDESNFQQVITKLESNNSLLYYSPVSYLWPITPDLKPPLCSKRKPPNTKDSLLPSTHVILQPSTHQSDPLTPHQNQRVTTPCSPHSHWPHAPSLNPALMHLIPVLPHFFLSYRMHRIELTRP